METEAIILDPKDLRKLQMVILEMMVEVDRICRKHLIKYSMLGGTLIGAVRHKGFIPWDDDLDISMSRRDYERFREICKTELNTEKYFFQDHTTDPEYNLYWAKILRNGTEFVTVGREHLKKRTGISLDVFINDGVPDFYPARIIHSLRCLWWRKHLYSRTGMLRSKSPLARLIYREFAKVPLKTVFEKLDEMSAKFADVHTKYVRYYTFRIAFGRKIHLGFLREWYENLCELPFEGVNLFAPEKWDDDLRSAFGDYMELPPPEKRYNHTASKITLPDECDFYENADNNLSVNL
jgi:lipopolysaccharide cholinephosphotransferase